MWTAESGRSRNDRVTSRLSEQITNDRPDIHLVETDNTFTADVLYRLGFSWPLPDMDCLEHLLRGLITLLILLAIE